MKIKRLYLLIIKSYIGPFLITFLIGLFVLLMQFLWKYIDDLVGKGLDWYTLGKLMFYAASTFVPMALPLAILLSSIMTFGNLSEKSELTAMKASGISMRTIMRPLLIISIMISIAAFYFSNNVLPYANLKMKTILLNVRQQKPALNIKEGIFYTEIDNYVIKIKKKEKDGQSIKGIIIYNHSNENESYNVTIAEKGKMNLTPDKKYLIFTLSNGYNYTEENPHRKSGEQYPLKRTHFSYQSVRFDLSSFNIQNTEEDIFKNHCQMLNIKQLKSEIDTLNASLTSNIVSIKNNFYKRFYFLEPYLLDTKPQNNPDNINLSSLYHDQIYQNNITKNIFKIDTTQLNTNIIKNFPSTFSNQIYETAINAAKNQSDYLTRHAESLNYELKYINKYMIEMHRKFTLSFACIILFFIGAPLGSIIKKGGLGLPLVISVVLFILFHILSITGEKMAREGAWNIPFGMWFASGILLPFGILLTLKVTSDTKILHLDFIQQLFYRFKPKNK